MKTALFFYFFMWFSLQHKEVSVNLQGDECEGDYIHTVRANG